MAERFLNSLVDRLHRVAADRDASASDGELLTRFVQTRDSAAFELIVWRHGAMVQSVCRRVLGRHGEIDDAFQATFLVLLRYARSIRQRDSLAGWLHGVALRVAHRSFRSLGARQRVERRAAKRETQVPADLDYSDIGPILDAEIGRLPERLRQPFVLCEIEGRTDAEVAAILAIPYGTVISRLSRARQRLRRRLVQRGVVLGAVGLASAVVVEPVSAALVSSTMRELLQSNAGSVITGPAATLAKGAIQVMFVRKMKVLALGLLVALLVSGAGVAISRQMNTVEAADRVTVEPDEPRQEQANRPATGADQPPAKPTVVLVAQPTKRTVTDYLDIAGRLQASSTVAIRPRVSGMLARVTFQDGAEVQQGQVLFEIDSRAHQAELDKARATLTVAEARLKLADSTLKRAKALRDKVAIGQEECDKAAAEMTEAEAAILQARANVEQAQHNVDLTRVTSPIRGQIGRRLVDPGNVVKADDTLLAEIVNANPMYVYCEVDERSLIQVRTLHEQSKANGKHLSVGVGLAGEHGFPHAGEVDFIDNQLNGKFGTATVRVIVGNKDKKMVPGMFARVRLMVSEPYEAMLVPKGTFRIEDGKFCVYVVGEKNTLERRVVEPGQPQDDQLAIKKGLKSEDRVVVACPDKLRDGMLVQPRSTSEPHPESDHPSAKDKQ